MYASRSSPSALCDLSNRLIEVQGSGSRTSANRDTRWIADMFDVTEARVETKWNLWELG